MKRYFILLAFSLLCIAEAHSQQTTFNRRYMLNPAAQTATYTIFCSVLVEDSGYFISGGFCDSVPPYSNGLALCHLNFLGDVISKTLYFMPNTLSYETFSHSLMPFGGRYIHLGEANVNNLTHNQVLSFIDSGDIISQHIYCTDTLAPLTNYYPLAPATLAVSGSNIYLASPAQQTDTIGHGTAPFWIWLTKTDSVGNRKWSHQYGVFNRQNTCPSINWIRQDTILLAFGEYYGGWLEQSRVRILVLDTSGNYIRNFYNSDPQSDILLGVNQLIKTQDHGYIFAAAKGWQRDSYPYYLNTKGIAIKLDSTGQEQWRYVNPGDSNDNGEDMRSLLELGDGSIIAAGNITSFLPADTPHLFMSMAKLSAQGQPIWQRRYTYFRSPNNRSLAQENYSVKECPDHGFILCGLSESDSSTEGWLVKTDSFGCLIPGCQLYDGIDQVTTDSIDLKLYPIPARDFINLMVHGSAHSLMTMTITDISGRTIIRSPISQDVTIMINTSGFKDGEYNLSIADDVGHQLSKKIVVMK